MTLGSDFQTNNTSVTTRAFATSWILRHRRQHHRRDNTIAETTPSQRQHHRRDHPGTEHLADHNPRTWTPITDHSGPNETPRTTPSQRASPGHSAPCMQLGALTRRPPTERHRLLRDNQSFCCHQLGHRARERTPSTTMRPTTSSTQEQPRD